MRMECPYSVLLLCAAAGLSIADVSVKTEIGSIIGRELKTEVNGVNYNVKRFLGIPYAKPPIGIYRFEKSELRSSFSSPYLAFKFGSACPQPVLPTMPGFDDTSEDCLYLNIYVPDQTPDMEAGHAVMVFIHGGGFVIGAGETYPAENLCSFGNVIVVTINYRLGVFGFMNSGNDKIRGNAGLFDQHLALKWVNQHIGAFGGDKDRVTIFGESAGGSSVIFQGLYPENKGLIHRVISQSAVTNVASLIMPNPRYSCLTLAKELECDTKDTENAIECLKGAETDKIIDTLNEMAKDPKKMIAAAFSPSIDGELIKVDPTEFTDMADTEARKQLEFFRSLDLMSGFTDKEGGVFLLVQIYPIEDLETFTLPRQDFVTKAAPIIIQLTAGNIPDAVRSVIISEYTNWTDPNSPVTNRDQYVKLIGDAYFATSSLEISRLHTNVSDKTQNSYTFLFTAKPGDHALKTPSWLDGANHGDDIGYVFLFPKGLLDITEKMRGYKHKVHDWEYDLSYQVATYWTNFAKSGNPNKPNKVSLEWAKYELKDQQYIDINKNSFIGKNFYAREANLWLKTVPELRKALSHDHDSASPFAKKKDQSSCSADGFCDGD